MVTVSSGRHRRFEEEPLGAAEYLGAPPGAAGPGAGAWEPAPGPAVGPQAGQIADYPAANGSPANPVPDWPPDSLGASWPQWGGPPPALYPDHPSAPVPRVRAPQAPPLPGPVPPGPGAPRIPSGPMAGAPRLPRRRPAGSGPSSAPNAGPRVNGAGLRTGGPGPANPARNVPRMQQDFNTGDIYESGQFPTVGAGFPERGNRSARPNRPGPGSRPARPRGPGRAGAPAGPPPGPAAPNGFARPTRPAGPNGATRPNRPAPAGGPARPSGPSRTDGPPQGYTTGQGFGPPGRRNANPGYAPAPGYNAGQGFGPPPGQGYRPASGGGGPGAAARTNAAPRQGYNGGQGRAPAPQSPSNPAQARGIDPGQGYPQPPVQQAGRRLYAVPDSSVPGTSGMGPAGGRMAEFGGGQAAVALADPSWQGGPQDSDWFRGGQMPTMPGGQAPAASQAWGQATAIREAAERDAAAIRQEAVAIREAAEREAADMRAAILSMSEQLSRMAAYVTETFPPGGAAPALAANAPAALVGAPPAGLAAAPPAALPTRPAPRPGAPSTLPRPAPGTRPARPATRPGRPVAKPGKSTTRPGTSQGRQVRAARKMFALLAILVTAGTITGTAQIVLHGGRFFIFRENGAGASETGLTDGQFPGHPGAPAPPKHAK